MAVRSHLEAEGWIIRSWAAAVGRVRGNDIVAELEGKQLIVEAKGEGSSDPKSNKFGLTFDSSQVTTHVSVATYKAMRAISEGAQAGVALPDTVLHRRKIDAVQPALSRLGVSVFWVDRHGAVVVV